MFRKLFCFIIILQIRLIFCELNYIRNPFNMAQKIKTDEITVKGVISCPNETIISIFINGETFAVKVNDVFKNWRLIEINEMDNYIKIENNETNEQKIINYNL